LPRLKCGDEWIRPNCCASYPRAEAVHFDLVVTVDLHQTPVVRVCSNLAVRVAGCSMKGRFISEAPNVLLDQIKTVRLARNLNYKVVQETVDDHFASVHRVVIPLSFDGRIIEEYVIVTEVVPDQ
jgi:hypothetical protein